MMVVTAAIGLPRIGLTQQGPGTPGRACSSRGRPNAWGPSEEIAGRQHLASWPERHGGSPPMILCAHDTWVAVGSIAHRMIATEPL